LIIFLIVALIFGIMSSMAIVRFAKEESFGAAFQFGEIFKIIGKIGWIHYILSIIVLAIIFAVIGFICGLLMIALIGFICGLLMIPLIGFILMLILLPFLCIWQARFVANLYESA
ncbi:MAG TPA: DUF4013 domain-containing protein, partial [Methanocorpusculum sp.]|nr:DUF4013 domain-containing protein [Methanocorpusculum sp.]